MLEACCQLVRRRHAIPVVPGRTGTYTLCKIFNKSISELGLAYPTLWILDL